MAAIATIWDFLSQRFELFLIPDASNQVSSQLAFLSSEEEG